MDFRGCRGRDFDNLWRPVAPCGGLWRGHPAPKEGLHGSKAAIFEHSRLGVLAAWSLGSLEAWIGLEGLLDWIDCLIGGIGIDY